MTTTLTGKTRFRTKSQIFGKPLIILQVEERVKGCHWDEHGPGPDFDYCQWRDAVIEDLTITNTWNTQ